jgi:hypothetical protein
MLTTLLAVACVICAATLASPAAAKPHPGPIDATVSVDASRSASAQISAATGGTIVVTAKNRTKMTLSIPAGALVEDVLVRATPVTKLASRMTRRGLLAGVQLEPEGLQLLKPATVRFARRGKTPKKTDLVFVGSEGDGGDIYRVPPPTRRKSGRLVPTGKPVVSISHFSTVEGFDWSKATLAELDAILRPALGSHNLDQEISRLIAEEASIEDILDALYRARTSFIAPLLETAAAKLSGSCSVDSVRYAKQALTTALQVERQIELIGGEADYAPAAATAVLRQVAVCLTKLCVTLGDPRVGQYFLSLSRQLQILGFGGDNAIFAALEENMRRCGAFEVRIDARVDTTDGEGLNFGHRVAGTAKVSPGGLAGQGTPPSGPLTYTSTSGSAVTVCNTATVTATKSGEFQVIEAAFTAFDPDHPSNDPVNSLKVNVNAQPMETYTYVKTSPDPNCGPASPFSVDQPFWFAGFQVLHPGFTFPGSGFFPGDAPVFARALYQNVFPLEPGSISENTLIEIVHTPEEPVPIP